MMNDLISVINKVQDILATIGNSPLDLPQIAVVGAQSSGKSSVLEAIVGKDFLPKGSGIVTRRPLILQLQNVIADDNNVAQEWAEFLHIPNRQFTDFQDVMSEIESETFRVAGGNKSISNDPIHLKINSPNVIDLTLVDLPGLTKIPVGDQPSDIEARISELVMAFIDKPNCIILAVSSANVDLANSDSLKLARQVDPLGLRTIGLLTKLDLMESGSSAADILAGHVYPLRLGFVGVVNRGQRDIELRRSIEYARKREAQFFAAHPMYANLHDNCGSLNLARTLNGILLSHIRDQLPVLKLKLNSLISAKEAELVSYGESEIDLQGQSAHTLILRLITKYTADFNASVDGTNLHGASTELSGGARLFHIFDKVFGQSLEIMDPVAILSIREIRTAMRNATGSRPALFIPEAAFDLLVKPLIAQLEPPCLRCVDAVYEELLRLTHESCFPELGRFPVLRTRIMDQVAMVLKEYLQPTRAFVITLVATQQAYINTSHPDFIGGANAVSLLEKKYEKDRRKRETADRMLQLTHQYSASSSTSAHQSPSQSFSGYELESVTNYMNGPNSSAQQQVAAGFGNKYLAVNQQQQQQIPKGRSILTYLFGSGTHHRPPSVYGPNMSGLATSTSPGATVSATNAMRQHKDSLMLYPNQDDLHRPMSTSAVELRLDHMPDQGNSVESESLSNHHQAVNKSAGEEAGPRSIYTSSSTNSLDTPPQDREDFAIALIRSLIASYFNIVRKALMDAVPKAVMHLLVNQCKEVLQNRLVQALYRDECIDVLLKEDGNITKKRQEGHAMLDMYQKALQVIAQAM